MDDDKLHEECGVFGVFCNDHGKDIIPMVYRGLFSLQHRGQESAGIAAVKDRQIQIHKGMGLVSHVFSPGILSQINSYAALGHVRYSTDTSNILENAQPFVRRFTHGSLAAAHNGALTNAGAVRELLEDSGIGFTSFSDGEIILNLIAKNYKKGLEKALCDTVQTIRGSFALLALTDDALMGARDPNGIRPLCLGQFGGGWMLSSESCAIEAAGGVFVRDIEPGEAVIINREQVRSFRFGEEAKQAVCAFEYVYFARSDSTIDGVDVYRSRISAGETLGREAAVEADLVIGVPDSGVPAAIGYGRATNTPFGTGIVKNKYIARTFILPGQAARKEGVSLKHFVLREEVRGKKVVLIDDSIVRGTTSRHLVSILKAAGAKEVHIRICSPPVRFPCYFGIDTPHREDLISNAASHDELCKSLGADSLAFISVNGLLGALSPPDNRNAGFCLGCFTGEYPVPAMHLK